VPSRGTQGPLRGQQNCMDTINIKFSSSTLASITSIDCLHLTTDMHTLRHQRTIRRTINAQLSLDAPAQISASFQNHSCRQQSYCRSMQPQG